MRTVLLFALIWLGLGFGMKAQVTSDPTPLQEDSGNVVIYFHADQGNRGLAGVRPPEQVYAHTGVITSSSSSATDWQYAPVWGDNSPKYQLEYVSDDLWKLVIGDIRSYYGVTDPAERIEKLAFVFRNADNTKEGKGVNGTDIFLNVAANGLQVALESNLTGDLITPSTSSVHFKAGATLSSDITITVNGDKIGEVSDATLLEVDYTFPAPGNYRVVATAVAGDERAEAVASYCYAGDSSMQPYPGGDPVMGTVRNADGTVTFCLAAPQKNSVILIGSWDDYAVLDENVMHFTDVDGFRYFWITVDGLEDGKMYPYYYLVDGDRRVGDPYARLVLDPYDDKYIPADVFPGMPAYPLEKVQGVSLAVYQSDINDYDWRVNDFKGVDKDDLIIYELLIRDFTGTEGKALGNGTVNGALEKLPYLKRLGVNAIELLPINEFNGNISWGYNPNFYFAPDKAYGTPDDYKRFIDACHEQGIAVILDMVFNQSDWQHPWYQMYPVGSNPFYNAGAPHAYSVLNDWNQGYGLVQKQWHDVIRYWMEEYRIDGYRFDLVKGLGDNDSYSNSGDNATNAYNASRVARMKDLQKVMLEVNPDGYFINENLAGAKEENEMAETGQLNWANLNYASDQFAMGYQTDSGLRRFYAPYDERTWGSTVSYMESHDEQRLAYKQNVYGNAAVKGNPEMSMRRLGSVAAQMLMAPGAHMIWQFSELGNYDSNKDESGNNNTDPKPVRWNLLDNPLRKGLYDSYCELISVRNGNPEMFSQEASYTARCSESDWTEGRLLVSKADGKELYTIVNPNVDRNVTVRVEFERNSDSDYHVLASSYSVYPEYSVSEKMVTLPAGAFAVIGSSSLSGVGEVETEPVGSFTAYATKDGIVVEHTLEPVDIFTVSGLHAGVITAPGGEIRLAPGIYVARSGNDVRKLMVR